MNISGLRKSELNYIIQEVTYAINQTKFHINETRNLNKDQRSSILSNIWLRTAENLEKINNQEVKELTDILKEKSKYWVDPEKFTDKMLIDYGMKLNSIQLLIDSLR
ncbi:hypothetical protein FFF34_015535 [Inquilinus sp. KBS0705]|nr:hypothetical protein FFF34_015535 [Inquilinus sp. KBS0705]